MTSTPFQQAPSAGSLERLIQLPSRALRWARRKATRALGRDYTDLGERVDIIYKEPVRFDGLDMYQKSHFRRYQFACGLLRPDMAAGDLACGTGYGTAMLASVARLARGYDISPVIEVVRARYAAIANVSFQQADILGLDEEAAFDAVVSFETLEHFPPGLVVEVLRKFHSMLRADGLLVLSTPFNQEETPASRRHHRSFRITEKVLAGWLAAAGFSVDRILYQNYQSHEIQEELSVKDFMVAVCRKVPGAQGAGHESG